MKLGRAERISVAVEIVAPKRILTKPTGAIINQLAISGRWPVLFQFEYLLCVTQASTSVSAVNLTPKLLTEEPPSTQRLRGELKSGHYPMALETDNEVRTMLVSEIVRWTVRYLSLATVFLSGR
jgi:hypothetical protein